MAPHAETAGQVQGVHGLRLELPKHRPAHGLQLLVQLLAELGTGAEKTVIGMLGWVGGWRFSEALCHRNISRSAEAVFLCNSSAFRLKEALSLCKEK